MAKASIAALAAEAHGGNFDRRGFMIRAAAGLSIGGALRAAGAAANEATPAADDTTGPTESAGEQEMTSASEHYAIADGEAEAIWFLGTLALIKGVGSQTGNVLATVEFTHPPGFATPLHVHHHADEAFYVLAGTMRGVCRDQEWGATTGSFVWLPRGIPHGYAVDGDEQLRTLAITSPAGFDGFVIESGEPALERTLPPPSAPDIEKLEAAGEKYGIETLGPPVQFPATPAA